MPKELDLPDRILEAHVHRDGETTTLALVGEFDLAAVEEVQARFAEACREAPARLVVDLSGLTFIDSAGIHFLVSIFKGEGGARLSFVGCDAPEVRRVFAITGLSERFGGVEEAPGPQGEM